MSRYKRYERYKDSGVEWIGEIPEHWKISKLKRLSSIITGNTPSKSEEENYDDEGISWVKPDNIQDDGTVSETKERLSVIGLQKARLIPRNSAIVCCIGTVGKVGFTQEDCTTNQQINSIVFDRISIWNNKYGFYCICSSKNEHEKYSNKVVVSILNKTQQGNILMPVPTLKEQKAIANFLDQKTAVIDGLIADKEKLIELLQEKRQAIITEAVTKGLNPNVKMKDSGIKWIGEIPEHWEVKRIKYLATVNPSKSEVRHLPPEQEVTFIPMEKIVATGKVDYSITNTVENLIDGYTYFRDGDIIMAKVTPCFENGNIAIVNGLLNGIGFGTTELHVLRCNNKCYNKFLFYYLQSDVFKSKGISEMYGVAGLKRIPTDFVLNYKLGIPDYQEQKQITLYLDTIVDKINTLISDIQTQIDKLKEYRQSIISEAVTGKIKIYNS